MTSESIFKSSKQVTGLNSSLTEKVRSATTAVKNVQARVIGDDGAREFDFRPADFERVRKMIVNAAGISLADSKQSMVYSLLAKRLRAVNINRFQTYLDQLENNPRNPEWEHFVNALTTNLTSFYRESHHFDLLKQQLQHLRGKGDIRIWCSAASTGEEPYTLAITAMEAFNSTTPPVSILATDIDTKVLETARKGVYRMDQTDKIPKDILKKYFLKGNGASEGLIRVRPELQKLIQFRQLNLLAPDWPIQAGFDAIFCRNVMIYFEKDVQFEILKRFAPLMNTGGLLYAGHSENFAMARDYFSLRGRTVYTVREEQAFRGRVDLSQKYRFVSEGNA